MAAARVGDEKEQTPHQLTATEAATSVRGAKSVITVMTGMRRVRLRTARTLM
jgi:hypothetical protein